MMMHSRFRSLFLVLGILLGLTACEGANLFTDQPLGLDDALLGSVRGQVTAAGIGVGGVTVIVVDGPRVVTDSNGQFRVPGLPRGRYILSVQVPPGFDLAAGEELTRTVEVGNNRIAVVSWRLQRQTFVP